MSRSNGVSNPSDQQLRNMAEVSKTLKEGERILAPSRRPDGTLRKPIRIRAGYVPREEVAIYQPKAALSKKEIASHNGYDPELDGKPKTKSTKKHEKTSESLKSQTKELPLTVVSTPPGDTALLTLLIHKRIRALKKKVRLTEDQLQKIASEQLEKTTKLESWRQELKLLEDKTNSQ